MVEVIVERLFDEPVALAAIQEIEDRGAWCLQQHRVRFIRTWFAKDRRRMVCLYEAPDAESVRLSQRKAGMPFESVWPASRSPVPESWPDPAAGPLEPVVVERTFREPITPEAIAEMFRRGEECIPRHEIAYLEGHISSDGRRMICVFLAHDAESVRIANRKSGAPFDRAWTASVHAPGPPPGQTRS